jgi:hypothetical protein
MPNQNFEEPDRNVPSELRHRPKIPRTPFGNERSSTQERQERAEQD